MDSEINQKAELARVAVADLDKLLPAVSKIRSEKQLKEATDLLAQIKSVGKEIKSSKDGIIKPLQLSVKNTRELFKEPEGRLGAAEDIIKAAILEYHSRLEAKAARQAEKIEEAVNSGDMDMSDGMAKLGGIKQAESNIKGEAGSANVRELKRIRIVDVSALPASYFIRERVVEALRLEVAEDVLKKKQPVPPGAEIETVKSLAVKNG